VSRRSRLEAYLYSRRNITGSLLALGGLGLFFTGLLSGPIWAPVVAGLYAIGVLLVPGERKLDLSLDSTADASEIRAGLDRLLVGIRDKVAPDIYVHVASIRSSIEATLEATPADLSPSDHNVYLIRQTALDYLPAALSAYLALPRSYAEGRVVASGRTPHDELRDQLKLMAAKMQEVADDLARHDSDRLFANGRFLSEKFAPSSLNVDAAASAVSAVAAPVAVPEAPVAIEQAVPEHEQERVR
jgi:hypothetical protein